MFTPFSVNNGSKRGLDALGDASTTDVDFKTFRIDMGSNSYSSSLSGGLAGLLEGSFVEVDLSAFFSGEASPVREMVHELEDKLPLDLDTGKVFGTGDSCGILGSNIQEKGDQDVSVGF
jgi:hypothetical protein